MRYSHSAFRSVVQGALLVALSVSVCTGKERYKTDPMLDRANFYSKVPIAKPHKDVPAIEVPRTTYAEMLGKGYALIGSVASVGKKNNYPDALVKEDLLRYAGNHGADAAWVSISRGSYKGSVVVPGGTTSYYHSGSDSYMHNGDVSTTTTYSTSTHTHEKTFKIIDGDAVCFAHDPELAAKQLVEGKKAWETRVAESPVKRATLLAKLDTLINALRNANVPPESDEERKRYITGLEFIKVTLQTNGTYYVPYLEAMKPLSEAKGLEDIDSYHNPAGLICKLDDTPGYRPLFKDPSSPQRSELLRLAKDARTYADDNWAAVIDFTTPSLPEHILILLPASQYQ